MLAAVAAAASTLKVARIIVEVLTDLLSANTRLDIKLKVALLGLVWFVAISKNGFVPFPV